MKVLDINQYEKLKIRPVNVNNMKHELPDLADCGKVCYEYIDPISIHLEDLKPGYVVKLSKRYPYENVWIFFDSKHMSKIRGHHYSKPVFVRGDVQTNISYLGIGVYESSWPKSYVYEAYNVTGVWKTNIDIEVFTTEKDVLDFYRVYKIVDVFKDL